MLDLCWHCHCGSLGFGFHVLCIKYLIVMFFCDPCSIYISSLTAYFCCPQQWLFTQTMDNRDRVMASVVSAQLSLLDVGMWIFGFRIFKKDWGRTLQKTAIIIIRYYCGHCIAVKIARGCALIYYGHEYHYNYLICMDLSSVWCKLNETRPGSFCLPRIPI